MKPVEVNTHGDQPIQQMLERMGASNMPPREHSAAPRNCKVHQKHLKSPIETTGEQEQPSCSSAAFSALQYTGYREIRRAVIDHFIKGTLQNTKQNLPSGWTGVTWIVQNVQLQGKRCGVSLFFISECAHSSTESLFVYRRGLRNAVINSTLSPEDRHLLL